MEKSFENLTFKDLQGEYKEFYDFHGIQLLANNFPSNTNLFNKLYDKFKNNIFDAGKFFAMEDNEMEESFYVKATQNLSEFQDIFIIDHAISFRYEELRPILQKDKNILERLKYMTKYWGQKKVIPGVTPPEISFPQVEEFDNMEISNTELFNIKEGCETLSFYGNNISDLEMLKKTLKKLPNLKALWVNENPIEKLENFKQIIEQEFPKIEILNGKFTVNTSSWGLKFYTFDRNLNRVNQNLDQQQKYLSFPGRDIFALKDFEVFKKFSKLKSLNIKEHPIVNLEDTNKLFALLKSIPTLQELYIDQSEELILFQLYQNGKLSDICPKLKYVNGHDITKQWLPDQNEDDIAETIKRIWRISGCYRLASSEQLDESSIWYVMDEFGSAIPHSDSPNFVVVPFLYAPNNKMDDKVISYSICWPIKNIKQGENIYRNYLGNIDESKQRSARLYVWFKVPLNFYENGYFQIHKARLEKQKKSKNLISSFEKAEQNKNEKQAFDQLIQSKKRPLKVLTDSELVTQHLTNSDFVITTELTDADIIFLDRGIKEGFDQIKKNQFVNQFLYEGCILMKQHLAQTITEAYGYTNWLQRTYDLEKELAVFIGEYIHREQLGKNNIWIIKPPNMARSMDTIVTSNVDTIIRLLESGPKLAQKYIQRPLTINKKKIDLRFVVALQSIEPLEVFIYKVFWIRTSNNEFTNDYRTREIYETHFTVMNYGRQLTQIHFDEFIQMFNKENQDRNMTWDQVYIKIKDMVKQLFIAVKTVYPHMHDIRCRAVYGMDVMIDIKNYQPKLLEMTFAPDCHRACKYHPNFYNDIFSCFFLGNDPEKCNFDKII